MLPVSLFRACSFTGELPSAWSSLTGLTVRIQLWSMLVIANESLKKLQTFGSASVRYRYWI